MCGLCRLSSSGFRASGPQGSGFRYDWDAVKELIVSCHAEKYTLSMVPLIWKLISSSLTAAHAKRSEFRLGYSSCVFLYLFLSRNWSCGRGKSVTQAIG